MFFILTMTRKRLIGDEDIEYYTKFWQVIEKEFFKLETLQVYDASFSPGWEEFCRGEIEQTRKLLRELLINDPARPYEKIKEKKIKFRRLHIVELPLSKYLYYEIESYHISLELGEEIFFISKQEVNMLEKPVEPQDLLLFDDKIVILQYYNSKGEYQYGELLDGWEEVRPYILLKQQLLSHALPMNEFLNLYKHTREFKNKLP